ncbi:class I SAM-dependent methyltransferase [uncultured Limosilactobacillus sp.]|uniref:class I SAM-dependent methyltransferase n=1 Tax=uncultured Limosilactobacillus sp. TaxID=2837629 RepID=UPI0025F8F8D9|nr:class I SAM-dependent methyltransferase [uncultured Limosilactobacillus sp.]
MLKTPEQLFKQFDRATELIQADLNCSYLDAFLENAENIVDGGKVRVEDDLPKSQTVIELEKIYSALNLYDQKPETIRRLLQLSLLKVIQKDTIQPNYQMTPDTIGMLIAYLIERVVKLDHSYSILDPVVGTGNLIDTVINRLAESINQPVQAYGIDNDESMLAVASVGSQLQRLPIQLFHQDAISNLDIPQVDLAVADLPVGYYPLDENAKNYQTRAEKGHSYVHHLLIEQTMNYLLPGGFAFFVVPSDLFQTKESQTFVNWIHSVAFLQGFVNLPADMFNSQEGRKSILILQNHGGSASQAEQVLLGSFPSLKEQRAFRNFMMEINQWVKSSLNR